MQQEHLMISNRIPMITPPNEKKSEAITNLDANISITIIQGQKMQDILIVEEKNPDPVETVKSKLGHAKDRSNKVRNRCVRAHSTKN